MELFTLPKVAGQASDGWTVETCIYRVRPRPKPKFNTTIDAKRVFGDGGGRFTMTTRVRPPQEGEVVLELEGKLDVGDLHIEERFDCVWRSGLLPGKLQRTSSNGERREEVDFRRSPFPLPDACYPDVLIPFLMRGQPRDGQRRAFYSWTSDRFVARVYYESRDKGVLDTPAGRTPATSVWLYPDLNDWISLGSVLTKLAKPLLPRYEMWFEDAYPHRVARFEGAFGPPGAPEVLMELA